MKKNTLFRIITVVVLNVVVISFGVTSFAAAKNPGIDVARPNWTYLNTCGLLFQKTDTKYLIAIGGTTATPINIDAYVYISLQQLNGGKWKEIMHYEDQGDMYAGYSGDQVVPAGYTYRLVVTHKAIDKNGKVLETFEQESSNYITYLKD